MNNYKSIKEWNFEDLRDILNEESNELEYKSSKVPLDILENKISVATSAFWNSCGGIFIAGVDEYRMPDNHIIAHGNS